MTLKNVETPFVRRCVALWLASSGDGEFTSVQVTADLKRLHPSLVHLDTQKAVSNELIRLEGKHKLGSRKADAHYGCGVGRRPRLYRKKIKFI